MYLTDVHCHVLPLVDDGPQSLEESVKILKEAYEQGVRYMIMTPHYRPGMFEPSMRRIMYSYKYLKEVAQGLGIKIRLGCENYRHEGLVEELLEKKRPTMAGSKYVLVEFSGHDLFSTVRNTVYELTNHGFKPIIAHVERYTSCQTVEKIKELKELGASIQVNAGSILGEDGWQLKRFCDQLMKEELIDFIGSDTHNTKTRKMNLKKCASYVKRKMGKKYAQQVLIENPAKIWKNR